MDEIEGSSSVNIVEELKKIHAHLKHRVELEQERSRDPNWQLEDVHIARPEIFELMQSPETPPNIRHLLLISTFAGRQWVYVGPDEEDVSAAAE